MNLKISFLSILLCTLGLDLFSKDKSLYHIMFYNCENLFDPIDDPHTSDNDFLPNTPRNWTWQKYQKKLESISKVILATGTEPPIIVGLAEVENYLVLKHLSTQTGLSKFSYKIVHKDSPDPRGIDVAAIYLPNKFNLLSYVYYRIENKKKGKEEIRTRDILYIKGTICYKDTLHIFFNHWPSRRSNAYSINKEEDRILVANVLRSKIDSVFSKNKPAKIIIMGDFNDEPNNLSIIKHLKTDNKISIENPYILYNWSHQWLKNTTWIGTYKFKNHWNIFDQIITTQSLHPTSVTTNSDNCKVKKAQIFDANFLLIPDEKYGNKKPFKTYNGMKYTSGFSDHLPVILSLECNRCQDR